MEQVLLQKRLIRYADLMPCKAAFIDAKTPGSDLKDNYSIIGGGVSESPHQKVNFSENHGFCIGAAGQPPKVKNSAHSHFTAEVFMVYKSNWRFYWNHDSKSEVILHPGDIISLPTNMFRGFENVGDEYGMIFSILGHDDAGGGVVWHPNVIEEAKEHGLILMKNGKLVDTTIGETMPDGMVSMPPLTAEQLNQIDQYTYEEMSMFVGKRGKYTPSSYSFFPNKTPNTLTYFDVIGPLTSTEHNFNVKPGDPKGDRFNVYAIESSGLGETGTYAREEVEVMLVHAGHFEIAITHEGARLNEVLKEGDIITFPRNSVRNIKSKGVGFAYLIVGEDYPKAPKLVAA